MQLATAWTGRARLKLGKSLDIHGQNVVADDYYTPLVQAPYKFCTALACRSGIVVYKNRESAVIVAQV